VAQEKHFNEELLTMYLDGELDPSESTGVSQHLDGCPRCQKSLFALSTASLALDSFHHELECVLPAPPKAWKSFETRLQAVLEEPVADLAHDSNPLIAHTWAVPSFGSVEARTGGWWSRMIERLQTATTMQWAPVALTGAAAALVVGVLLLKPVTNRSLSVEAVLQHARVQQASLPINATPVVYQRLRVRDLAAANSAITVKVWNNLRTGQSYEEVETGAAPKKRENVVEKSVSPLLQQVNVGLAANHVSWKMPVSTQALADWTSTRELPKESVREEKLTDGTRAYRLVAEINPSEDAARAALVMRSMEIVVRASDWHAVSARYTMSDNRSTHTYEIAELEYKLLPLSGMPAAFGGGSDAIVSDAGSAAPMQSGFQHLAVSVLERLDRIDALAQDQLTLSRSGSAGIDIRGVARSEARRSEILLALGSLASDPSVHLTLSSPQSGSALTAPGKIRAEQIDVRLNESGSNPEVRAYIASHQQLDEQGLEHATDRFVSDAVNHLGEAELHADALVRVVAFLPSGASALDQPADRMKLIAILKRHASASHHEIVALEQQLAPVFGGGEVRGTSGVESGSIEEQAAALARNIAETDRLLWKGLAGNASAADRKGLTECHFWLMLRDEDSLSAHIIEKLRP